MKVRAALVLGFLLVASPAGASGGDPQDLANDISQNVMSPFCPGVTLHDCASPEASRTRDRIVKWARAGWSRQRIVAKLEDEFGPSIHATPSGEGAGVLAWILPAAVALSAGAVAFMLVRRWSDTGAKSPSLDVGGAMSGDDRLRLDRELKRLRQEEA